MRETPQSAILRFRASAKLAERAAARAEAQGITFSELVRAALCRELQEAA